MEYAVIMAGGTGTRFWPKSTVNNPKQCLCLNSDVPMIKETVDRLEKVFDDRVYIATGNKLKESISKLLPNSKFILEPLARNTTACIGLSCVYLLKNDKDAVIFLETADHVYDDEQKYYKYIRESLDLANEGKIVIMGITPFEPHTGFGYINFSEQFKGNGFFVRNFVEKPSRDVAMRYLQEGGYLWNSGMYIFRADKMLEELQKYEPEIYNSLMRIYDNLGDEEILREEFEKMKSIQIDCAVSERSDNLVVVKADMPWDDIGSWTSLERHRSKDEEGNVVVGKYVGVSSRNNIVFSDKLVTTIGMSDMIIVSTKDSILVCPKDKAEQIKLLISKLKEKNMNEFL